MNSRAHVQVDFLMPKRSAESEPRTFERLRAHYLVERELAARLRAATREERRTLYASVYDELFRRVPDHPQLAAKAGAGGRDETAYALRLLKPYLRPDATFLEIGAGDCALSVAVAPSVERVFAVDVSREVAAGESRPANFELIISDGTSIPAPAGSVDVAFSDQLMEHLAPEDALAQLRHIQAALAPGGVYVCLTPNRLSGPHDISMHFDEEATGFHLKEYTVSELCGIFKGAGFSRVRVLVGAQGRCLSSPAFPFRVIEGALGALPARLRKRIARTLPCRILLGARIVAVK